jgi:hypothetical protein
MRIPLTAFLLVPLLPAQDCTKTSIGQKPLPELGTGTYQGKQGGLYPSGANVPPPAHAAAGLAQAGLVQPRNAAGAPDPNGRIVLLSIGMSNTTQEFSTWVPISNADPRRAGAMLVVDGAQGGQDARIVADPNANFWNVVQSRLAAAGATAAQVQAIWLKEAVARPTLAFPAHATELQGLLAQICNNLSAKFPQARLCYLSSRIYAGYATTTLNPEPYAYESGFAVKWLIEQQIAGDPALNFDPTKGPVRAPWLAWGPYLWADGTKPRAGDGLTWICSDFQSDGTHPSLGGRAKVAGQLDRHFTTDPTTTPWYFGPPGQRAALVPYGAGCAGSRGALTIRATDVPRLGDATFRVGATNAVAGSQAVLFLSLARASLALDGFCTLLVDPVQTWASFLVPTGTGSPSQGLPIPSDNALAGLRIPTQWFVRDPAAPGLRFVGGGAMTGGLELVLGF